MSRTDETQTPGELLALFTNGPTHLTDAVIDLTDTQLDVAQTANGWTIRQIVHHIVDGDDMWKTCIKAALGNSEAILGFQWYWDISQDEWAKRWNYAGRAIGPSLALFAANRRHVEQLIQQIPGAWERSIQLKWSHKEERITVGDVVGMQARHTVNHIEEIRMIRQNHGF